MLEFAVYTCHGGWLHVTGHCDGIWRASEHFKAQQDQGGGELPRNQQMLKTDLQRVDRRTRRLREVRQEPRRHDGRHRHRSGRHACRCARHARRDACGGHRDEPLRAFAVISLPTICDKLDMESPNASPHDKTSAATIPTEINALHVCPCCNITAHKFSKAIHLPNFIGL